MDDRCPCITHFATPSISPHISHFPVAMDTWDMSYCMSRELRGYMCPNLNRAYLPKTKHSAEKMRKVWWPERRLRDKKRTSLLPTVFCREPHDEHRYGAFVPALAFNPLSLQCTRAGNLSVAPPFVPHKSNGNLSSSKANASPWRTALPTAVDDVDGVGGRIEFKTHWKLKILLQGPVLKQNDELQVGCRKLKLNFRNIIGVQEKTAKIY